MWVSATQILILLGWRYGLSTGIFKNLPGDSMCGQDATMGFASMEIHPENNRVHSEEFLLSLITEQTQRSEPAVSIGPGCQATGI